MLPPTATFTAGVASNLPVTFRTAGRAVHHRDGHGEPAITGSGSTTVTPGPAAELVFTVQPSNAVAGASIAPAVKVGLVDRVRQHGHHGHQQRHPRDGQQPGRRHAVRHHHGDDGQRRGHLQQPVHQQGGHGLHAGGQLHGPHRRHQRGLQDHPGARRRSWPSSTQPSNAAAGAAITPAVQVAILDAFGNTDDLHGQRHPGAGHQPGGGTLSGTTTVAAVNGVATFSNLSINKVGTGYTLTATSGALTSATSDAFDITPAAPYRVTITRQPTDVAAGAAITPAVQATALRPVRQRGDAGHQRRVRVAGQQPERAPR